MIRKKCKITEELQVVVSVTMSLCPSVIFQILDLLTQLKSFVIAQTQQIDFYWLLLITARERTI